MEGGEKGELRVKGGERRDRGGKERMIILMRQLYEKKLGRL